MKRSIQPITSLLHLSLTALSLSLPILPASLHAQSYPGPTQSSPIAISRNDRLIWVVNPNDDSVSVIRPDNLTRITKVTVGDEPQSIALTPNGQYAYVANAAGNSVSIIKINDPAWGTFSANLESTLTTGAEPWNVVVSPDGQRVFVSNSGQDTISVIDATSRTLIGQIDLRNSIANDPDRNRHFQPRGLAVTADNKRLYVTRFLSFTRPGGRQGDDFGKEGLVALIDIDTGSSQISDYKVSQAITLPPLVTGFKFNAQTNPPAGDTFAFPNQLQAVVLRGNQAYLPNIAASPSGPLRFNLDTHAFVNVIGNAQSGTPTDFSPDLFLNLHLGARVPETGKKRLFFANPWAIAFTSQSGEGTAYVVSSASDLLVKLNVSAQGKLAFTESATTTRYIDLNDPENPATSGRNAGKNPIGIAITSDGTRAYVANFVSRNVSVVNLQTDSVIGVVPSLDLPAPGSRGETVLVGAEMFFSSRGHFDPIPGFTNSLHDRLSSEGWQACSSCHFHGLTDGVVWQFGAGPRKSVPLNATFNPHNPQQQRILNYSAIFDEVEDFELNIRNVSGPGPIAGGAFDPNHGLLIADNGTNINLGPGVVNAFAKANADRPQMTVTLPGSSNAIPALTALREWVRSAVRTPNSPLPDYGGAGAPAYEIELGREYFLQAGCAHCHGGTHWTTSLKDFTSPTTEFSTERNPTNFVKNPIGTQYLNRFLRDGGSFNLGIIEANPLGDNIGAVESASAAVANGTLGAAPDGLGIDYNGDGKGVGFNVPSLLGIVNLQPYTHNGGAESLAAIVGHKPHRTQNGTQPDLLSDAEEQALVVKFLQSIDFKSVPFVPLTARIQEGRVLISFDSLNGIKYALEAKEKLTDSWFAAGSTVVGTGSKLEVELPKTGATRFVRLTQVP